MKLFITIDASSHGLYVLFRGDSGGRGFVIKPRRHMMFSERNGGWRGLRLGPLYFRTFKKRNRPC